jgi:glycosyltransferase involved in cell wall biosynthesis
MARHDVFVFPSLFEGFGLVILEAMSQGLPVIVTPNTGAVGVVENGVDGFLVPVRDVEAICAVLEELVVRPGQLQAMRVAAQKKAAMFSWERYRERLSRVVLDLP